jgi:hypothetical protein
MIRKTIFRSGAFFAALLLLFSLSTFGQSKPSQNAGGGMATFTVTAVGKKQEAPPISKDDVQLLQGKERKQIADWKKGEQLYLAIVIDDSIDTTAGGQWDYLREFIMGQPASTFISVSYMRNNTVMVAQDFTQNHELAAKALRLPVGTSALGSSPYLSLIDLLKRWPENSGPRRSILVITPGIDWFRGERSGPIYPDVDPLSQRAQRQNTNIWSIYFPSSGHRGRSFFLGNTAQTNISKMSDETGAESYWLGFNTPVSIKPWLDEISTHLSNQYLLTFAGSGGQKGRFVSVNVRTELPDVEFLQPSSVFIPAGS